jgi:hypothetical protein
VTPEYNILCHVAMSVPGGSNWCTEKGRCSGKTQHLVVLPTGINQV